jgi:hypothetical protein
VLKSPIPLLLFKSKIGVKLMDIDKKFENIIKEQRKHSTSEVFEMSKENMAALRELYDTKFDILCPVPDTNFEQFCGYMIAAGTYFMQKEYFKFSLKKLVGKVSPIESMRLDTLLDKLVDDSMSRF